MTRQALLIFAKNPELGKVKTRLAASIGHQAALSLYRLLLYHTMTITEQLPVDKFVFYSDLVETEDIWDNQYYTKELQHGPDLGTRMEQAFGTVFGQQYDQVAIIGTDCLELTATIITNAFECLDHHDVVIGPAKDGGYYLLAMKKPHPALFKGVPWSTNNVLAQTLEACRRLNLSVFQLPVLSDVDVEADIYPGKGLSRL